MGGFFSSVVGGSGEDLPSDHSGVVSFHSAERFQLHLNSIKDSNQLMVIDFAASWCGPCKFIEPAVHAMTSEYTDVSFARIDVDELPGVSQEFGVTAMPTFVLLKGGKEIDRVTGADKNELERKIQKYSQSCRRFGGSITLWKSNFLSVPGFAVDQLIYSTI